MKLKDDMLLIQLLPSSGVQTPTKVTVSCNKSLCFFSVLGFKVTKIFLTGLVCDQPSFKLVFLSGKLRVSLPN
jgi:hypothetical protein